MQDIVYTSCNEKEFLQGVKFITDISHTVLVYPTDENNFNYMFYKDESTNVWCNGRYNQFEIKETNPFKLYIQFPKFVFWIRLRRCQFEKKLMSLSTLVSPFGVSLQKTLIVEYQAIVGADDAYSYKQLKNHVTYLSDIKDIMQSDYIDQF